MKKLLKIVGFTIIGLFILAFILAIAFPTKPELEITSFKTNDEVLTENLEVRGKYKGIIDKILVNGEETEKKYSGDFRKILKLNPGENKIKAEAYKRGQLVYTTESVVYYDLEGKLYQEKEVAHQKLVDEEIKENTRIPIYELVRKEESSSNLSGIVYAKIMNVEAVKENLVVNLVKDIKSKNAGINTISLLIFSKEDKQLIESLLENTDSISLSDMSKKVRAEYNKTIDSEQLFIYPTGLEGDKLAVSTI